MWEFTLGLSREVKMKKALLVIDMQNVCVGEKHEIECVEVVGVDGGACVSLTALGAIDAGYKVIVNETGIGTMFRKKKDKYFEKLRQAGAEVI